MIKPSILLTRLRCASLLMRSMFNLIVLIAKLFWRVRRRELFTWLWNHEYIINISGMFSLHVVSEFIFFIRLVVEHRFEHTIRELSHAKIKCIIISVLGVSSPYACFLDQMHYYQCSWSLSICCFLGRWKVLAGGWTVQAVSQQISSPDQQPNCSGHEARSCATTRRTTRGKGKGKGKRKERKEKEKIAECHLLRGPNS